MVNKFTGSLVSIVFLMFAVFIIALPGSAQEDVSTSNSAENTSSEEDRAANREARLQALKAKRESSLTDLQATRIKNRCTAAQTKLAALLVKDQAKINSVAGAHARISESLLSILDRLQSADVNTTALEQVIEDFQNEVSGLEVLMADHIITLTDLSEFDCEADPEAFQAALLQVREDRASIKQQIKTVREFLQNNVKPALQSIKSQIATGDDSADTTEDEDETSDNVISPVEE